MIDKKGISAVVTTVLLIMISVIAVVMIAGFIIPMIKNNMNEGTSCYDLIGHVKILENEYSCYNTTNSKVMIERTGDNFTISGIMLSLLTTGNSRRFDINSAEMPLPGEAKTYVTGVANVSVVKIAAVTSTGKVCDAESYILSYCE